MLLEDTESILRHEYTKLADVRQLEVFKEKEALIRKVRRRRRRCRRLLLLWARVGAAQGSCATPATTPSRWRFLSPALERPT